MADNSNTSSSGISGFGFNLASLRKSAQELSAKAAASVVSEYNKSKQVNAAGDLVVNPDGAAAAGAGDGTTISSEMESSSSSSSDAAKGGSTMPKTADNVSKQELLDLLGKMNKKVKALNVSREQLNEHLQQEQEKIRLFKTFVQEEILTSDVSMETIEQFRLAWRQKEEQDALVVQSLQQEFHRMQQQQQQEQQQQLQQTKTNDNLLQQEEKIQKYEQEILLLKEEHLREIAKLQQEQAKQIQDQLQFYVAKEIYDNEVAKIKEAAQNTLKSFKEKVAAARQAELEKLRNDSQAALFQQKKMLEKEWTEKILQLQQQPQPPSPSTDNKVGAQQQQYQQQLIQLQQLMEQKTQSCLVKDQELAQAKAAQNAQKQQLDTIQQKLAEKEAHFNNEMALNREQVDKIQKQLFEKDQILTRNTAEMKSLQNQVVHLQGLAAVQKSPADSQQQVVSQNQQLFQQLDNLQKQIANRDQVIEEKTRAMDLQKNELAQKWENLQKLAQKSQSQMVGQNQQLVQQLDHLQKQMAQKEQFLDHKTREMDLRKGELVQKLENLQKQNQVETRQVAKLQEILDVKSKELDHLKKVLEQKEMLVAHSTADGAAQEQQQIIEKLQNKIAEKDEIIAAKNQEIIHHKQQLDQTLEKLQKDKNEVNVASSNNQLSQQVEMLQRQVGEHQELLVAKSRDIEDLKQQLQEKENLLAQKVKEVADVRNEIKQQLAKAQDAMEGANKGKIEQALVVQQEKFQEKFRQLQEMHSTEMERICKERDSEIESNRKQHEETVAKTISELEQKIAQVKEKAEMDAAAAGKEKEELRKKMEEYADKMTTQFKAKLKAFHEKSEAEMKRLQSEKEELNTKLTTQQRTASLNAASLQNEIEDLKGKLSRTKEEMKMTVENNSATATSLIEQQEKLEREKGDLEALCQSLEKDNKVKSKLCEELKGKVTGMEQNLSALSEEKYEQEVKLQAAARNEVKLKASQAEVADLREQLNKLKLEHTKNANLVARLQAEKETNERNHGERTALVAMLETQLNDMNDKNSEINARLEAALYDLSQKDEVIRSQQDQVLQMENELAKTKEMVKRTADALTLAQKSVDSKSNKQVEAVQRELLAMKQQMAKKSSAAQQLLQERELECVQLRKANQKLQEEVDKGTLSDRRIFELAAKQSNRESLQVAEVEIRDRVIENLKMALLERDGDLAFFEKHVREVEGQVEELCRVRRREDVNLDYLKSVVVKYLSLPPGSSERARLLPVLATLLQFDDGDYQTIEEGKHKLSWWGNIAPTLIGTSTDTPHGSNHNHNHSNNNNTTNSNNSAEVSVRTGSDGGTALRTSLQF